MATYPGTYGSNQTQCQVFTHETVEGTWYACEGSQNVNLTNEDFDHIVDELHQVDVEVLIDFDTFTAASPIQSESELEAAVNS